MEEQSCPRCKTTSYRNPNLKLLVNVCGHKLCQTCVDVLFTRPSAACPQCQTALRRNDFRMQQFEDAGVEREVDIRKKMVKIFNRREEDFSSFPNPLRAYNDYLEETEVIIFNMVNKVDIEGTKRKVDKYKKDNENLIRKNNSKFGMEDSMLSAQLEAEKREQVERAMKIESDEKEEEIRKKKEKESLINDLIYANAPANEVIARHMYVKKQQEEEEKQKRSLFFTSMSNKDKQSDMVIVQAPLFEYEPPAMDWKGPTPPTEDQVINKGYLSHIRSSSATDKASGFNEKIACQRALQEAFDCLFL